MQQGDFFPAVTGTSGEWLHEIHSNGNKGPDAELRFMWMVQSDGRIEVVVGTDAATLGGHVLDERSEPSVNVKVALVPDAPLRRRWDLYKSTTTDQSGNFTIRTGCARRLQSFCMGRRPTTISGRCPISSASDEGRGKAIHIGSSASEKIDVPVIPAKRR